MIEAQEGNDKTILDVRDELDTKIDQVQSILHIETQDAFEILNDRIDNLGGKFDTINKRFDNLEKMISGFAWNSEDWK